MSDVVAVVAIGRNEGERLARCLESIPPSVHRKVYVDSGSVDGSVELARRLDAEVVELDMRVPFTAARARNAGVERVLQEEGPTFVLALDGDCELDPEFIGRALRVMSEDPRVAVVCGRRREKRRDASIYNALCDMEWDTPIGEAKACGGDALIRLAAYGEVGGYDAAIIAGEEPEFCLRLRRRGWVVRRIDCEMTRHDAAMTSFGQWWKRAVRAGHAYAEMHRRHGHWRRDVRSAWFYGLFVPFLAVVAAPATSGLSLAVLAAHALLYARVLRHRRNKGDSPRDAALYARFCVISKFAHVAGMARFVANRALGRRPAIIEYKQPKPVSP